MNVYVVCYTADHEGDDLAAVFSTLEAAECWARGKSEYMHSDMNVYEVEVDRVPERYEELRPCKRVVLRPHAVRAGYR